MPARAAISRSVVLSKPCSRNSARAASWIFVRLRRPRTMRPSSGRVAGRAWEERTSMTAQHTRARREVTEKERPLRDGSARLEPFERLAEARLEGEQAAAQLERDVGAGRVHAQVAHPEHGHAQLLGLGRLELVLLEEALAAQHPQQLGVVDAEEAQHLGDLRAAHRNSSLRGSSGPVPARASTCRRAASSSFFGTRIWRTT